MHVEGNTEQPTGTTPPANDQQQTQQQLPAGGDGAGAGTAQIEGQQQEGQQQGQEQRERDEQGRFKPPVQKRIDELTRARREAEREAETLRQQLAQLQPGGAHSSGQGPAANKPTPEQFQDYAQYVEALTAYQAEQLLSKRDQAQAKTLQERAQQAQQQADHARAQAWGERQQAARTALPDYDTVMSAAANVHVSQAVQEAILDSDRGPELAYHLAKNPALAQQLSGMSARHVDREIGRLEERLARPAPPPVSKAPPPLKPLTGSGAAAKDPSQMSDAEYRAWRLSQKK